MGPGIYNVHEPPDPLKPYVRRLMHALTDQDIDVVVRPAPTGFNYLGHIVSGDLSAIVDGVKHTPRSPFHFAGQIQSQDIAVHYRGRMEHILAEFTATGLHRMYGVSGAAIHGKSIDVEAVAPALHARLTEAIVEKESEETAVEKLIRCLGEDAVNAAPRVPFVDDAVDHIERDFGAVRIGDIARNLDVHERTLTRQFREIVGLPPKFYARVVQMNRVLGMLMSDDQQSLTQLAQDCGYFDQSHFNKAMLQFFQQSPREFLDSKHDILDVFLAQSRVLDRY